MTPAPLKGIALPTRARQLDFSSAWLKSLRQAGYTAVAVQNDPFPVADLNPANGRESADRLFFLYTLGNRPAGRRFRAYIRECARRAHEAGLQFMLDGWEPCVPESCGMAWPEEWRGMGQVAGLPTGVQGDPASGKAPPIARFGSLLDLHASAGGPAA